MTQQSTQALPLVDFERLRAAGASFNTLIDLACEIARGDADIARRLRLWMADCVARVLRIYEAAETSDAPRKAIVAARRFARGEISEAEMVTASDAAWAARVIARDAASDAARVASAASWAASAAIWADIWAAGDDEQPSQFDRLIARMGAVEPEDYPLPERKEKE